MTNDPGRRALQNTMCLGFSGTVVSAVSLFCSAATAVQNNNHVGAWGLVIVGIAGVAYAWQTLREARSCK